MSTQNKKEVSVKDIQALFPWAKSLLTGDASKGYTMSAAQRLQEENHNKVSKITSDLAWSLTKVYDSKQKYYHENGIASEDIKAIGAPVPKDFDLLEEVAKLNGESAIYGAGKKIKALLISSIDNSPNSVYEKHLGITEPLQIMYPKNKDRAVIGVNIESFCELSSIDDMIPLISLELMSRLPDNFILEALALEAKATVYSKQSATPKSFLRKLSAAEGIITEGTQGRGQVTTTYTLALAKEDYVDVDAKIKGLHNQYQSQKNGYLKTLKDAARKLQGEYDDAYVVAMQKYQEESSAVNALRGTQLSEIQSFKTKLSQVAASLYITKPIA